MGQKPDNQGEWPDRDLRDEDLGPILETFYRTLEGDALLAPYFATIDMQAHMPRIVAFWSTMLFNTRRY